MCTDPKQRAFFLKSKSKKFFSSRIGFFAVVVVSRNGGQKEIIYKKLSATALFRDSHYFIGEKRRAPFPLSGGVKKEKQKFKRSRTLCARINFIHLVKRNNNEDYT